MSQNVVPFRQFVLKVHSRCDLACDHCYVYEHSDQSWRGRPKDGMTLETAAAAASRIAEHARAHRLPQAHVILHGGEPLLLGVDRTREVLEVFRDTVGPVTELVLRMHTNGVLLSEEFLELLLEYDVRVGVSLDGGRAANDLHRLDRRGRSSYDRVAAALSLLRRPAYRRLYSGLLCTIDVRNDPTEVYRALLEQEPPRIDFLLPHATWEHQPPGLGAPRDRSDAAAGAAPYARWLGEIFALWDTDRRVPVRTFDSILAALHGRPSGTESLGLVPADLLVIETDGTLEQADWLKTAYEGAAATGFDVFRNQLDDAAAHAGIMARQLGLDGLCATCRACPVVSACGGGLYVHRYSPDTGFDNPSVYCPDLMGLITQIGRAGNPTAAIQLRDPDPVTQAHTLSRADFDSLASGHGTARAIESLTAAQGSIRRELLARLAATGPQHDRLFTEGWDRLAALDESSPDEVNHALSHPFIRFWAERCLDPGSTGPVADPSHLAAVAISAHLKAGKQSVLSVALRDGQAYLPGYGVLRTSPEERELVISTLPGERLAVEINGSVRTVVLDERDELDETASDEYWWPLRRLATPGFSVTLDDLDIYRNCLPNPAPRVADAHLARWRDGLSATLDHIERRLPLYAPSLLAGLSTLVPLSAPGGAGVAATDRRAFGAVGMSLPDDVPSFVLALLRGVQRMKINALAELCPLVEREDIEPRFVSPWNASMIRTFDLLEGAYIGVAGIEYQEEAASAGTIAAAATADASLKAERSNMEAALTMLLESGSLTELGRQVVTGLSETAAAVGPAISARRTTPRGSAEQNGRMTASPPGPQEMIGYRRDRLRSDLVNLGVRSGTILLVQASMRAVAPAAGATSEMFDALIDALGPEGTLVVPAFTSLNSTTSRAHKAAVLGLSEEEHAAYVDAMPIFDPATTPSQGMGALAEYVRTRPGAYRSSHPHTSFAAVGRRAAELMAVHDEDCHLGLRSPLGAMYQLDADNLLLGLEYHQGCTMIHLAEYLAAPARIAIGKDVPTREYRARTVNAASRDKWTAFTDLDLDDGDFKQIGAGYDALGAPRPGLRRGVVGASESRLVGSKHIVAFATAWMVEQRP